jgi:hypothetical protein
MYQRMIELLDFADEIGDLIRQDDFDKNSYFMTLIYVEDILDKYGRGIASHSARDTALTEEQISEIRKHLNARLDALRSRIRNFSQAYNFDDVITERSQGMLRDWSKRD